MHESNETGKEGLMIGELFDVGWEGKIPIHILSLYNLMKGILFIELESSFIF